MEASVSVTKVTGVTNINATSATERKADTPAPSEESLRETPVVDSTIQTTQELKRAKSQGENIPISEQQVVKAIDRAVKAMEGAETTLQFSIHKETKQIMVKVLNKDTGEVIREIPPEKTLDLVAKLWQMAGIFVDERR